MNAMVPTHGMYEMVKWRVIKGVVERHIRAKIKMAAIYFPRNDSASARSTK
jgi:hypothetical protein